MHGVRLVSTPAKNSSGNATSGRPDIVAAMFVKSIDGSKAIEGGRDTERIAFTLHTFPAGASASACPILAAEAPAIAVVFLKALAGASTMHVTRFSRLALAVVPFIAACNEDNEFGLGAGAGTRFSASLSGANVRPVGVSTSSTGTAELSIQNPPIGSNARTLAYSLNVSSLTSATAAHIHLGGPAVANGQQIVSLYTNSGDTAITATQLVTGAVSEDVLPISLDSLVVLMRNGTAYIDVHSTANPAGLIRGQLTRTGEQPSAEKFAARVLNGAKERPAPVTTTATGAATFEVLSAGSIRFTLTVAGITGATMAHIHTAVADSAGPIVVPLFNTTTPTGLLTGTLASGTITAANITMAGVSVDSLLSLMRRGRTYVNVHTVTNPLGEIRAQVDPTSTLP